jgi:hypothetical protein
MTEYKRKSKNQQNIIKLTDDFRVIVTSHNHKLEHYTKSIDKKTNKSTMIWSFVAYCSSLTASIKTAMKEDTRCADSLKAVLKRIEQFEKKIDQELKGV